MAVETQSPPEDNQEQDNKAPIPINRRFTIYPGKQVTIFNASPAMAYKVVDNEQPDQKFHGLVCDPKLHPRLSLIEHLQILSKTDVNIHIPTAWSVMDWEDEGRQCPVLVMNSGRLEKFSFHNAPLLTEETVVNMFLRHSLETLRNFEDARITHRAIHLDNLFYFNELKRRIIIGECLSTPPGLTQSTVYDTIDNALSVPLGKGSDAIENDIYALGVLAIALLNGREPCAGMSDEEIINRKMMYGSFETLRDPKVRLSSTMESCLRKMTHDNIGERATIRELMMWLNGQNFRIETERPRKRSSKPFTVKNKNYFTARDLARGMHTQWDASAKVAMSDELKDWLQNNLSETEINLNYEKALKGFETSTIENQHRVLARVLLSLHQDGPVRYRSFCASIDGITRLISHFVHNTEARQIFREMMGSGVIDFWFDLQDSDTNNKTVKNYKLKEQLKSNIEELRKDSPIEGLNLMVYDFNTDLPCQSKRFERYFVYQPKHLLPTIENLLENDTEDEMDSLLDFQMICFLKARYSRSIAKEVRNYMITSVPEEVCVAEAEMLSKLQMDFHTNIGFPIICRKLCTILEPAVKQHHSRTSRRAIRKEMLAEVERGHIRHLIQIVSDKGTIESDKVRFNLARAEYASLLQEIRFVDFNIKNLHEMVARIGGDTSASISGILATLITLGYVSYWSLFQ